MDGAHGHVLAEDQQEALDLAPFAEADCVAEVMIMATAGRCLVHREHTILPDELFCNFDAAAIGNVK